MSKYFTISLAIVALVIGLIGGYAVSTTTPKTESKLAMQTKQVPPIDETGLYTDQQFLRDMIAHHTDAVEMSKRVLVHTSRKEVRELATTIIEAQTKEIAQMEAWLQEF